MEQKKESGEKKSSPKKSINRFEKIKFGDKDMGISEYASSVGINRRLNLWLRKKYKGQRKTGFDWHAELQKEGVSQDSPEILKKIIQRPKK